MFVVLVPVVAVLSAATVPGVARAGSIELLTNGDLELPHSGVYPDSMGVQPDVWTAVSVGAPGDGWVHYTGYAPYVHTGSYSEALNCGNYIYQITGATVVAGQTYDYSGWFKCDPPTTYSHGVSLYITPDTWANRTLVSSVINTESCADWTQYSSSWTATAAEAGQKLILQAAGPGDTVTTAWSIVDSLSLTTVGSVPEPSSLVLVSAGVFGLLAYAWRKRR
jgi:hypothetical protein